MIVHPYFRRRGIGRRLLEEIEQAFPQVKRFEAFTGAPEQAQPLPAGQARLPRVSRPSRSRPPSRGSICKRNATGSVGNTLCTMNHAPEQTFELIPVDALLDKVRAMRQQGCRLVQISATRLPGPARADLQLRPRRPSWPICACTLPAASRACRASAPSTGARSSTRTRCTTCSACRWTAWRWISKATFTRRRCKFPFGSAKAPAASSRRQAAAPPRSGTAAGDHSPPAAPALRSSL